MLGKKAARGFQEPKFYLHDKEGKEPLFSEGFDEEQKQAAMEPPESVMDFLPSSPPAKGDHVVKYGKMELDRVMLWYAFDKGMKYSTLAKRKIVALGLGKDFDFI